ncbi:hypothetical protein F2P81_021597 [Scophthalmus maximus]|uniref:Secreted protein n=1 Tax=Scophthalmus maximus TaxID=52904 RepID=A0A6A4S5Q6_SCOMX|nr:hypothetical protein F2P81_021597 [Scophthalmus maximus]
MNLVLVACFLKVFLLTRVCDRCMQLETFQLHYISYTLYRIVYTIDCEYATPQTFSGSKNVPRKVVATVPLLLVALRLGNDYRCLQSNQYDDDDDDDTGTKHTAGRRCTRRSTCTVLYCTLVTGMEKQKESQSSTKRQARTSSVSGRVNIRSCACFM